MEKNEQLKKVARCVRAMLDLDGLNVSLAKVVELIANEDLSDHDALKAKVKDSLSSNDMRNTTPDRRKAIEDFLSTNWSLVKNNDTVRSTLLSAYTRGRYSKQQQEEMRKELLDKLDTQTPTTTPTTTPKAKTGGYDF